MKNNFIIFTFIVFFILLGGLGIYYLQNKKENFPTFNELVQDVLKFLLLPNLTLNELNNLALTNKTQLQIVNQFLKTKVGINLSTLNTLRYFVYTGDNLFQPDLNIKRKEVANFLIKSLFNLFDVLRPHYLSIKDQKEENFLMVDFSNLPVFESYTDLQKSNSNIKILLFPNSLEIYKNEDEDMMEDNEEFNLLKTFFLKLFFNRKELQQKTQNNLLFDVEISISDNELRLGFGYVLKKIGPNRGFNEYLIKNIQEEKKEVDWLDMMED